MEISLRDSIGSYLEIGKEMVYLTREECMKSALSTDALLDLAEKTLESHGKGAFEMPAKIGIHPKPNTFMHAMPAYIETGNFCGIKWVTGFPENREKYGLQQTVGLSILNDYQTGYPMIVMGATWVTTERTAAVSMISLKHSANKNTKNFGMIGCGSVGRKHVEFIESVLPNLEKIYIFDNYELAMDQLTNDYQSQTNAEIIKVTSYGELVKESEVIASATVINKNAEPKIKDEWITSGKTIILCDGHTLYENVTLHRADQYISDSIDQQKAFEKKVLTQRDFQLYIVN